MVDTLREHLRRVGRIGGKVTSARKRRAGLRNLKKANAAKAAKRAKDGSP